jgi:hypothetical protein
MNGPVEGGLSLDFAVIKKQIPLLPLVLKEPFLPIYPSVQKRRKNLWDTKMRGVHLKSGLPNQRFELHSPLCNPLAAAWSKASPFSYSPRKIAK